MHILPQFSKKRYMCRQPANPQSTSLLSGAGRLLGECVCEGNLSAQVRYREDHLVRMQKLRSSSEDSLLL